MKLIFDDSKKTKMVGIRIPRKYYDQIATISDKEHRKIAETCRAIIISALKELK